LRCPRCGREGKPAVKRARTHIPPFIPASGRPR
jgi:hypothetical protein